MKNNYQYDLRFLFAIFLAISLGIGSYQWMRAIDRQVQDSSSLAFTARLVVQHLESNQGEWPSDWNDLEDDHQNIANRKGALWSVNQLKDRVDINWNVDLEEYFDLIKQLEYRGLNYPQSLDSEEFMLVDQLITLKNGTTPKWSSPNSKTIIFNYLKREYEKRSKVGNIP